jgi:Na+-driven multidrug efflux pump
MLWTLLTLVGSLSLIAGSIMPLMEGSASFTLTNCAVALSIGTPLAVLNFCGMKQLARIAQRLWEKRSERVKETWARLLYLAIVLWMPIATLITAHIVSLLVS